MSNRKFYLRHNYQAEHDPNIEASYPLPRAVRDLGAIAYQYRLAASASVVPALDRDSPLRESLGDRGFSMAEPGIPTASGTAFWKFASRPFYGDTLQGFSPWADALLTDEQQREAHEIGQVVLEALHENRAYLARYDGGAGNNFYLVNFITARAQNIGV